MSEPDEPRFPEHLATSVRRSHFHVIENADISDQESLDRLLFLLFSFPERSFYVFLQKHASLTEPLRKACDSGDLLVTQSDLEFFPRPKSIKDFVRIRRGHESFEWEREVTATSTEYIRFTIVLSHRKRQEMGIAQHLQTQAARNANPLKLEPNLWGIGIDLRKVWSWLRSRWHR